MGLYQAAKAIGRAAMPASIWANVQSFRRQVLDSCRVVTVPWQAFKVLNFQFGHLRTIREKKSRDAAGQPIPWYVYPAIEYLKQLDFSDCSVFEWGSGHSTLFWSARARKVIAIELDKSWYEYVAGLALPNMEVRHIPDLADYINAIENTGEQYDVIVVDGFIEAGTRLRCCEKAIGKLKPGGMIILDNSEWLPQSCSFLRSQDLIEVNLSGFGPIEATTWTTTLFLRRDFRIPVRTDRPRWSIGNSPLDLESNVGIGRN